MSTQFAGRSPTPKRVYVGHRGQIIGNPSPPTVLGSPNNYTRYEGRFAFVTPPVRVCDIQFAFPNWFYSNGEQVGSNALLIDGVVEMGTTPQRIKFGFASSTTLATGATILSDIMPVEFAPNSVVFVRFEVIVSGGQTVPSGAIPSIAGEAAYGSSAASQTFGTGPLSLPSGGAALASGYIPLAMIGTPEVAIPAAMILGDSIPWGLNDNGTGNANFVNGFGDGNGNFGWVTRGMWNAWTSGHTGLTGTLGQYRATRSGDTLALNSVTNSLHKREMMPYATAMLDTLGINDMIALVPLATIQTEKLEIWGSGKAHGLKVHAAKMTPHTSSTSGNFLAGSDQTFPVAAFAPGGDRDTYNAWLDACVANGTIDGVVDPNPYVEDPANHGKFLAGTTVDGTHFIPTSYDAAAAASRAWCAGLRF